MTLNCTICRPVLYVNDRQSKTKMLMALYITVKINNNGQYTYYCTHITYEMANNASAMHIYYYCYYSKFI